ncbi:MAG: hypothetical protein CMJ39_03705, partial [Phycisphaerae bacterium]|nr:hypothetical protein [Phycisphaerae bacterium]
MPNPNPGKPTWKQRRLLKKIVNPEQKEQLLKAIANREPIPLYAWTPVPAEIPDSARELISEAVEQVKAAADQAGVSFDEALGHADSRWHVTKVADVVRDSARDEFGILETPLTALNELAPCEPDRPLLMWLFFNPYGPTMLKLVLWEDRINQQWLIGMTQLHPFQPDIVVYGILNNEDVEDNDYLESICCRLFRNFGFQSEKPIMESMPTSIIAATESPLTLDVLHPLVKWIAEQTNAGGFEDNINYLKEHWLDPWARTAAQRDDAMNAGLDAIERGEQPG